MKEINVLENKVFKGLDFWTNEIEKAGVYDKLKFFNDVVIEQRPPHPESGYEEPVLTDVFLDGKNVDIYHSDNKEGFTLHRLFIYIKN